jgi:hypothetical protein
MSAAFTHPLARDAKVWETNGLNGTPTRVLVIITTLELDKANKSYKADKVSRLADAAKQWLQQHALEATDFVMISRPRDWH